MGSQVLHHPTIANRITTGNMADAIVICSSSLSWGRTSSAFPKCISLPHVARDLGILSHLQFNRSPEPTCFLPECDNCGDLIDVNTWSDSFSCINSSKERLVVTVLATTSGYDTRTHSQWSNHSATGFPGHQNNLNSDRSKR